MNELDKVLKLFNFLKSKEVKQEPTSFIKQNPHIVQKLREIFQNNER
jgi:hypothetical protein